MTTFGTNRDEGFEDLLTELVDAHVDTIELFVARDDAETRGAHVDYLQIVRALDAARSVMQSGAVLTFRA